MKSITCGIIEGDGIGPEIVPATREIVSAAVETFGERVRFTELDAGFSALDRYGTTYPEATHEALSECDGWILGPLDTAAYPPPHEGGLNPSGECRSRFALVSNHRPARPMTHVPTRFPDLDCVVLRENTEGFYADRSLYEGAGELRVTEDLALSVGVFTKTKIRALMKEAVDVALNRGGKITFGHKANVLPKTMGLYLETARECVSGEAVEFESMHLDALAEGLVRFPDRFDVIVLENMSGDVISDLTAGMVGGLGIAPSLNTSVERAMAQAVHGSAPQIAGSNIANPVALTLSSAMLLRWLTRRRRLENGANAADLIEHAIGQVLAKGKGTPDVGGSSSTSQFAQLVVEEIAK